MITESTKLDMDLKAAGIPIHGVCYQLRRIDFKTEATPVQRAQAAQIMAAFDPSAIIPEKTLDERIKALEIAAEAAKIR